MMMMTAPTSTARSARTTPMRAPAIRTAGFIARRPDGRPSFAIWATPTMENRHGLAVAGRVTHANGTAERRASETMLRARRKAAGRRITAGEDKAYDTADHVANLRAIGVTPHVTQTRPSPKPARPATAPSTNEPPGIRGMPCRKHA